MQKSELNVMKAESSGSNAKSIKLKSYQWAENNIEKVFSYHWKGFFPQVLGNYRNLFTNSSLEQYMLFVIVKSASLFNCLKCW